MFEVGFFELVIIFGVALMVLGPSRLPGLVSKVGKWVGKARRMAREFREQLENEVNLEELNRATDPTRKSSTYPAPPPEFGGDPMVPSETAQDSTPPVPDAPEPDYYVPPPGDASHNDLSEPQTNLDFNSPEAPVTESTPAETKHG